MRLRTFLLLAVFPLLVHATLEEAPRDQALAVFKQGDYKTAIPLLQAELRTSEKDIALRSALLSALVYEDRLDEAGEAADAAEAEFPDSPEMLAARGEYKFYIADMGAAEQLFRRSLQLKENARACYGLARINHMQSRFRTSRLLSMRAHMLDPDDALITSRFLTYVPKDQREPQLSQFMKEHPWFYKYVEETNKTEAEIKAGLGGQKAYEQDGPRTALDVKLIPMMRDPTHTYGVGLDFRIDGGHHLRLLLDTGASGVLLIQRAVDKAELNHLGSFKGWGIGDDGKRDSFAAIADSCEVGPLHFKRCVVRSVVGNSHLQADADGLIGADFFSEYLITIDFQKHVMHLSPLPSRPPNPQRYDAEVPPEERDFTPVLRQGNHLYLPTKLNDSTWGLFLLDTGAGTSNVDSNFARLSTKIHGNSYMKIRGISGQVKNVFEADKAVLQFGQYRQNNLGLIAFDLNNHPEDHQEFRMSGILGMPVLSLFRLSIDYRNGLVKFDYVLENKSKRKG